MYQHVFFSQNARWDERKNKKTHSVGTFLKYNRKITERVKIFTPNT